MAGVTPAVRLHDTIAHAGGQARSAPPAFVERVGPVLAPQGFVAVPVALVRDYARLSITDGELALLLQLWQFWRDEALPCPAVSTLAAQLGKTVRQVQQLVAGLRTRGLLLVKPRHDPVRGQLSNAYDLGPLLRALEALPRDAAQGSGGMVPIAGEGVHAAAGGGVHLAAPNEDPPVRSLVLVSDPPDPPQAPGLPEDLAAWLDHLGDRLGDSAPASSRTRAARLLARCGLNTSTFRARFTEAATIALDALPAVKRRGKDGTPNGMPYCFAVLEALLEDRPKPSPRAWPRVAHPQLVPHQAVSPPACGTEETAMEDDGHPLWPAVVTSLAGVLAPTILTQRVRPLRSRSGNDGTLELVAPDCATARWVEMRLGQRIQEALDLVAPHPPAWRVIAK